VRPFLLAVFVLIRQKAEQHAGRKTQ